MKRIVFTMALVFLLSGCVNMTFDEFRMQNRQNLMRLSVGMTKQQALDVMGTGEYKLGRWKDSSVEATLNNPYKSETLQGKDKTFEVLYYYTDKKRALFPVQEFSITDDELTPLVFDEGKLIGWGWGFLEQNVQKYEIRVR